MLQSEIKSSFVALGNFLRQFSSENYTKNPSVLLNDLYFDQMADLITLSQSHNGWFTSENVIFSLHSWAEALTENNLNTWLAPYSFVEKEKKIGLILAGNIPLVGFHDLLSVLVAGHKALVKTSTNDQHLLKFLVQYLNTLDQRFSEKITFVDGKLEGFDAVIATGSNNTARYFEYYFSSKPHIIRKNRNSIAILTGNESHEDLVQLGEDIFRYFGLGCRNVSKLFVPKDYNFDAFFKAIFTYQDIIKYEKYANNYDYNKAVYLMSNYKLLDNGFLTLRKDSSYSSPISSVFYEFYEDIDSLKNRLQTEHEQIQCIVSDGITENSILFGQTQQPKLWDYADNVDTMDFLIHLK